MNAHNLPTEPKCGRCGTPLKTEQVKRLVDGKFVEVEEICDCVRCTGGY